MQPLLTRADLLERKLCIRIHSISSYRLVNQLFRVVSRLGDGVLWYGLLSLLALLGGLPAAKAMLHVGLTALLGVVVYSYLKNRLVRQRPFISHGEIDFSV